MFVDRSVHPPEVAEVEHLLDSADTDDLIESFPAFLVSEPLAARLAEIPGLRCEPATVAPGDAWLDDELRLCVSARVMALLREFDLRRCDVSSLEG